MSGSNNIQDGTDKGMFEPSPFNAQRVERYTTAMTRCPNARRRELLPFLEILNKGSGRALDLCSSTGYVAKALHANGFNVDTVDLAFGPALEGGHHFAGDLRYGLPNEISSNCYSAITALACAHHLAECAARLPDKLVQGITRVAKNGCQLIIADVPNLNRIGRLPDSHLHRIASLTGQFFTNIVDQFSRPKHGGMYVDFELLADQFAKYGWVVKECLPKECSWEFDDKESAFMFITQLLNLKTSSSPKITNEIYRRLQKKKEEFLFVWSLDFLIMEKK